MQDAFDLLAAFPGIGARVEPPIESIPELRFWPIKGFRNYLILYRKITDGAEILRVVHGARDLPALLRGK